MALEAQNNPYPSILIAEHADPESIPDANPAAGYKRLVVKDDLTLWLLDDTGTATEVGGGGSGDITTDAAWAAKGDLIAGTGVDTASILTVGANDRILMADSGQPTGLKWVASQTPSTQAFSDSAAEGTADTYARGDHVHGMPASGGGSMVWLQRQSASASAELNFDSLFSSTYDVYEFHFTILRPATDNDNFFFRARTGGSPANDTGSNYWYSALRNSSTGSAVNGVASGSPSNSVNLTGNGGVDNGTGSTVFGRLTLYNPLSTVAAGRRITFQFGYVDNSGASLHVTGHGAHLGTTAMSGANFLFGAGNITSGYIDMYGLTHA